MGNPTSSALEQKLAAMEGADEAVVVASGMAAISSILYALTQQGDEVAFIDPVYGGTDAFLRNTLIRAGVTVTSYSSDDDFVQNHRPNTRLVLWEPITNPTLKVIDSRKIVAVARSIGAITGLRQYLFNPLFVPTA